MRVINPTIENTIEVVLRKNSSGSSYGVLLTLEGTSTTETLTVTETATSIEANQDQLSITIPADTFSNNQSVSLKVTDNANNEVAHRNKIFFTTQVPQNYSING